jgi:hexosaminidase
MKIAHSAALTILIAISFLLAIVPSAKAGASLDIIPEPASVELPGGTVRLAIGSVVVAESALRELAEYTAAMLSRSNGAVIEIRERVPEKWRFSPIILSLDKSLERLGSEGYQLVADDAGVTISSSTADGVFYGIQTLRQLLPPTMENDEIAHATWLLPRVKIEDSPRFSWRGLMMDCSRTFQPVSYLEKVIDLLSLYKMNVLHLHLTDDQGWRLQIHKYPLLTETGARFAPQYRKKGGFYTKEEMKKLIDYAGSRGVTIVPEIELPGHSIAALASYPELSCTGGPFEIYPFFKGPSIQSNVFCAGREETFGFLQGVLNEVAQIFPGRYVHVGGDEVPKDKWRTCPACQARIRDEGLKDEHELQSYFIRRIEKHLNSLGKQLIGWDEILEGGLAPGATVMSWRGIKGGIDAARMGHDVVMSPTSHCYLDYDHQRISVERAYSYEPVPLELEQKFHKHILGVQGNIWTHIAVNQAATDIQVFPRLIALAEVGWSDKGQRSWKSFSRRLAAHNQRLDLLGVEYYGKK